MSNITIVGLGSMGSALARTLLTAGHEITIWNRSREKAKPLVAEGAMVGDTLADSIAASPVILVCVSNYSTTREILESGEAPSVLADRTIVQLSSGTPREAIDAEAWCSQKGASYLDGAILGSPKVIGTDEGQILISGKTDVWEKHKPLLECLAGNFQHTGAKIDSAKILDLAWLSQRLGLFMGVFQGLLLCEAGEVGLDVFSRTVAVDARVSMIADTIHNGTFNEPVNTAKIWADALHHIQVQAKDTDANAEVLEFIADKFQRAESAGFEDEDLAALIKVFR